MHPPEPAPDYVSAKLQAWADHVIALEYIQLVKPQQNAYVELYNQTVPHEWPKMAIGGGTPAQKPKLLA